MILLQRKPAVVHPTFARLLALPEEQRDLDWLQRMVQFAVPLEFATISPCLTALCIFHGPHAYISPAWYQTSPAVPTWNYAAVHVYGRPAVIKDERVVSNILDETIRRYEGTHADEHLQTLPQEFRAKMIKGIVAFEIEITRIEGKFKLGQNRSQEDLAGVYRALDASADPEARKLADLMRLARVSAGESKA